MLKKFHLCHLWEGLEKLSSCHQFAGKKYGQFKKLWVWFLVVVNLCFFCTVEKEQSHQICPSLSFVLASSFPFCYNEI